MRTIAVLNQKGGVGKTTTTVNTAAALATLGLKVVVIDLDPQAHLTIHLGVEPQTLEAGSYEVLTQSADFESSLMMTRPNLWLLGANINLVGAETELVSVVGREIILREAMASCADKFDFCLIDCAPSLGLLSLNALAASQEVLIPLQPHFLALQGFGKLLQTVDLVNKRINRDLKVTGVLLCMFDTRASLPNEVRADIDRFLTNARGSNSAWADAQILPTFIRRNIKLAEAPSYGRTIFEYDPTCNGAADYKNVARFFMGLESQTGDAMETEAESEAEAEQNSLMAAESQPIAEPEVTQSGHDSQAVPESAQAGETVVEPEDTGEDRQNPQDGSDFQHASEVQARPESYPHESEVSDSEPRPVDQSDATSGPEPVLEPEPQQEHHNTEPVVGSEAATGEESTPKPGVWGLHHTPELLRGPDRTAGDTEATPDGEFSPVSETSESESSPQEAHYESRPEDGHNSDVNPAPDQPTPIQIREFQLPAPPLQSFPVPPVSPAKSSQDSQSDDETQHPF